MKSSFLKSTVALVTCGLLAFGVAHAYADQQKLPSGTSYDQIGQKIENYYQEHEKTSAGLATTVFDKDGNTLYQKNFGYTDKEKKLAVDDKSVFEWGSTTKITVWVSVIQLWEEGKIDLKTDIREYLPQNLLKNLKYDKPITMLDLMNHQAGFEDYPLYIGSDKDLGALMKKTPSQIYEPGTVTSYSNYGTALAGYIVERISGQSFADYVHEHIFQPLGMKHTALKPDLSDNVFVQKQREKEKTYDTNGDLLKGDQPFVLGEYPAGRATGTFADIKKFAQALLQKEKLFKRAETWENFYSASHTYPGTDIPVNAHGLWVTEFENTRTFGHGGNSPGFTTSLLLDLKSGIGSVVTVNQRNEFHFALSMPDLIYGKKKEASKAAQKDFQAGFYREARIYSGGPLSIFRVFKSTSYLTNPSENAAIKDYFGFWTAGERGGNYILNLPISDRTKLPLLDVIQDYGSLLLAGRAALYVALCYLSGILAKLYRLLTRKNKGTGSVVWSSWHYLTGFLILWAFRNLFSFFSIILAKNSFDLAGLTGHFQLFALLAVVLLISAFLPYLPFFKERLKQGNKYLTLATSSAAFIIAFNIFYWSLYQWWAL